MCDQDIKEELLRHVGKLKWTLEEHREFKLAETLQSLQNLQSQLLRDEFSHQRKKFFNEFEILFDNETDFTLTGGNAKKDTCDASSSASTSSSADNQGTGGTGEVTGEAGFGDVGLCNMGDFGLDPQLAAQLAAVDNEDLFTDDDRRKCHTDYRRMVQDFLLEYGCTPEEVNALFYVGEQCYKRQLELIQQFEDKHLDSLAEDGDKHKHADGDKDKHAKQKKGEIARFFQPTMQTIDMLSSFEHFSKMMRDFSASGYYLRKFIQGRDSATSEIYEILKQVQTPPKRYWQWYNSQQGMREDNGDEEYYTEDDLKNLCSKYKDPVLNHLVTTDRREGKPRALFDVDLSLVSDWKTLVEEPDLNVSAYYESTKGVTVLRNMLCLDCSLEAAMEILHTHSPSRRTNWDKNWSSATVDDISINFRKTDFPEDTDSIATRAQEKDHSDMIHNTFGPHYPFGSERKLLQGATNVVVEGEKFIRISTDLAPKIVKLFCDMPETFVQRIVTRRTEEFGNDVIFYGYSLWDEDTDTSIDELAHSADKAGCMRRIGDNKVLIFDFTLTSGLSMAPYWVISHLARVAFLPTVKEMTARFADFKDTEESKQ